MAAMKLPPSNSSPSPPRRFLLLPEESLGGRGRRPRIRRYQLSSIGRRIALSGIGSPAARIDHELDRLERS
jgi:hypothetical protein